MPNPLVTVIIPTRNRRQLVLRAVDSALRQDFQDFEIIVIDDGSSDGTAEALADKPRCRVIRTAHGGPAAARNTGIAVAAGTLLAFLDSDDFWHANHLSQLVAAMGRPEVGMAYSPTQTATLDGTAVGGRRDRRKCYSGQALEALFRHIFVHTSNIVCRTRLVREVGGFDESLPVCEDYHLWLRLALRSPLAFVDEATAIRCWHGQALSRLDRVRNAVVRAAMLERFYLAEGGQAVLPARAAHRRLGKVFFQAGRALAGAGQRADALKFFAKSLRYRPMCVRGWMGYVRCWLSPEQMGDPASVQQLLERLAWTV